MKEQLYVAFSRVTKKKGHAVEQVIVNDKDSKDEAVVMSIFYEEIMK